MAPKIKRTPELLTQMRQTAQAHEEPFASEPVVEPVAEPVVEPVAEPIANPVVEPVGEPIREPIREPIGEQAPVAHGVPKSESESERVARLEQELLEVKRDVRELKFIVREMMNRFNNGELRGRALETLTQLDRRVRHIENYLRMITGG